MNVKKLVHKFCINELTVNRTVPEATFSATVLVLVQPAALLVGVASLIGLIVRVRVTVAVATALP